jgi:chromosome partitioning protein
LKKFKLQQAELISMRVKTSRGRINKVFNALVKEGVTRSKLVFSLSRVGTEAEEVDARSYISQAGYETLEGCLFEKPAYRKAMNSGLAVTETRYKGLNQRADELIQALIDKIGEE